MTFMRNKTRERVTRLLIAAFLKSDMSNSEIQELSDAISSNPEYLHDFSMLLKDVIDRLQQSGTKKFVSMQESPLALQDIALAAIQRRKLSKKDVLSIMAMVAPPMMRRISSKAIPMRHLLREFFSFVSPAQAQRFLSLIDSRAADDAYLQGIIRRSY